MVIDSDDLVDRPSATAAYCEAVCLPYLPGALQWEAGERAEWSGSSRWHEDTSGSTGFKPPKRPDRHGLESHDDVVGFAARHRPFYERLHSLRLDIIGGERTSGP